MQETAKGDDAPTTSPAAAPTSSEEIHHSSKSSEPETAAPSSAASAASAATPGDNEAAKRPAGDIIDSSVDPEPSAKRAATSDRGSVSTDGPGQGETVQTAGGGANTEDDAAVGDVIGDAPVPGLPGASASYNTSDAALSSNGDDSAKKMPPLAARTADIERVINAQGTTAAISPDDPVNKEGFREGKWTEEEHELFLSGMHIFGRSWTKIAKNVVKTRSIAQVRSHAQKYERRLRNEREKMENSLKQEQWYRSSQEHIREARLQNYLQAHVAPPMYHHDERISMRDMYPGPERGMYPPGAEPPHFYGSPYGHPGMRHSMPPYGPPPHHHPAMYPPYGHHDSLYPPYPHQPPPHHQPPLHHQPPHHHQPPPPHHHQPPPHQQPPHQQPHQPPHHQHQLESDGIGPPTPGAQRTGDPAGANNLVSTSTMMVGGDGVPTSGSKGAPVSNGMGSSSGLNGSAPSSAGARDSPDDASGHPTPPYVGGGGHYGMPGRSSQGYHVPTGPMGPPTGMPMSHAGMAGDNNAGHAPYARSEMLMGQQPLGRPAGNGYSYPGGGLPPEATAGLAAAMSQAPALTGEQATTVITTTTEASREMPSIDPDGFAALPTTV